MKLSIFTMPIAATMLVASAGHPAPAPTSDAAPAVTSNTIVYTAMMSADHSTPVAALSAAGPVDILSGSGPFTIFAPTNAAFDKLPAGTVDMLLGKLWGWAPSALVA